MPAEEELVQASQVRSLQCAAAASTEACSIMIGPVYREYMAKSWQAIVSHRLTLYRPDPNSGRVCAHWAAPQQQPAGDFLSENTDEVAAAVQH